MAGFPGPEAEILTLRQGRPGDNVCAAESTVVFTHLKYGGFLPGKMMVKTIKVRIKSWDTVELPLA